MLGQTHRYRPSLGNMWHQLVKDLRTNTLVVWSCLHLGRAAWGYIFDHFKPFRNVSMARASNSVRPYLFVYKSECDIVAHWPACSQVCLHRDRCWRLARRWRDWEGLCPQGIQGWSPCVGSIEKCKYGFFKPATQKMSRKAIDSAQLRAFKKLKKFCYHFLTRRLAAGLLW